MWGGGSSPQRTGSRSAGIWRLTAAFFGSFVRLGAVRLSQVTNRIKRVVEQTGKYNHQTMHVVEAEVICATQLRVGRACSEYIFHDETGQQQAASATSRVTAVGNKDRHAM